MTFNDNVQLDTSQATSGGSSGGGGYGGGGNFPGGIQVGGGIGGLILLVLMFVFGGNVLGGGGTQDSGSGQSQGQGSSLDPNQVSAGGAQSSGGFAQCKTGADANKNDDCLVIATVNSVQAYWGAALPQYGRQYTPAKTVLYSGETQSACGTASNQVGPFYCPLDKLVYIDSSFFAELQQRFGANGGQLAKEYVVAHEYGHHVQDILGILGRAQQDPQGPESGSVRLELMADCLAGMWVKNATTTKDANGTTYLKRSPSRTSTPPCRPPRRSATTGSRRPRRAGSTPSRGRTGRAPSARSGSPRATRAATSTSATPSRPRALVDRRASRHGGADGPFRRKS